MIARAAFFKLLVATGGLDIWDGPMSPLPSPAPGSPGTAPTIRVLLPGGSVAAVDIESYVRGVVALEMPPSWPPAALQAQAILARTYGQQKLTLTRAYDVVAGPADQEYGGAGAERPATDAAVDATRGMLLSYLGGPADVFYSACCGGHTADIAGVWGGDELAYLRGVPDPYCSGAPDYRWQRTLPLDRARALLGGRVGAFTDVELGSPDDSGRPLALTFSGAGPAVALRVTDVRARWGTDVVRSLWLDAATVTVTQAVPNVDIEGCGRGHGLGLCQWGARGMAIAGADAQAILAHYFPGTAVTGG